MRESSIHSSGRKYSTGRVNCLKASLSHAQGSPRLARPSPSATMPKALYRWKSPTPAIPHYVDLDYRRILDSGGEYFIVECAYRRSTASWGEAASAASQS